MSDKITWNAILERAQECAKDAMPEFPKSNTVNAWEEFQIAVEDVDELDTAHEMSEWDWVIYFHHAMQLCQEVPMEVLHGAESDWHDMGMKDNLEENFGLYEYASQLAAIIVTNQIGLAVANMKAELVDLAENQMMNLEG